MIKFKLLVILFALTFFCGAQTLQELDARVSELEAQRGVALRLPLDGAIVDDPVKPSFIRGILDPTNLALTTYALSQIAASTTDWHWTIHGKEYRVNAVERTAFAGGSMFAAMAVAHYKPGLKPYVTAALVVGTAYLSGRAYANTLARGVPPSPAF